MKNIIKGRLTAIILMVCMFVLPVKVSAVEALGVAEDAVSKAEQNLDSKIKGGPSKNDVTGIQEEKEVKKVVDNYKTSGNNYPVVLVHGLLGWGNTEIFDKNYWGWNFSIRDMLNSEGFEVYTPTVGAVSSNWDRACELYAYLVGGTVDYGQAHAEKYGHSRYGKTYPGAIKNVGQVDKDGNVKKIHLMGHSMGGETSRVLAQLLENGSLEEMAKTGANTSPLFTGGKHWIESITTITTPHDGSTFDEVQYDIEPFFHRFVAALAAVQGGLDEKDVSYDFRLEQWGLKKQPGESDENYINRVFKSRIWDKDNKDLSLWDLSLEGAAELNSFAKAQSDIYYFSISCTDTHKSLLSKHHLPNINMNPALMYSATVMGRYTQSGPGKITVDSSWFENDGLVNKVSGIGPHSGSTDKIVNFNGTPQKGVWNYLGNIENVDHLEIIFINQPWNQKYLRDEYRTWVKMVRAL